MAVRLAVVLAGHLLVTLDLTVTVELFLLFAGLVHFAHRLGQNTGIMFGVLGKVFGIDPVIGQLRIAVQLGVFFDDLLRRAAHFAIGARAVEHPVDDIAARRANVATFGIAPRP